MARDGYLGGELIDDSMNMHLITHEIGFGKKEVIAGLAIGAVLGAGAKAAQEESSKGSETQQTQSEQKGK
jgi:hypothetical protein